MDRRVVFCSVAVSLLLGCSLAGLAGGGDGGAGEAESHDGGRSRDTGTSRDAESGKSDVVGQPHHDGGRSQDTGTSHDAELDKSDVVGQPHHDGGAPAEAASAVAAGVRQTIRNHSESGTTATASLNRSPLAGSIVCVTVFSDTSLPVANVTGAGVSTWNVGPNSDAPSVTMVTYWGLTSGAGATVTVALAGSISYVELYAVEVTGASGVDSSDTNSGDSATPNLPFLNITGAGDVIVSQSLIEGGAVTAVDDNGFVDSYPPIGNGPGVFQSYDVLGSATSYSPENYTAQGGPWYSQAIAFKPGGGS